MDTNKLIVDGLTAKKSRMAIITDLVRADKTLDLTSAGNLYKEVATKQGFMLSTEQKDALTAEVATAHVADGKLDRAKAVDALVERGHMSKTVATNKLKAYCVANKIEFPAAAKRDMEAVKKAYTEWHNDPKVTDEQIKAGLVEHFGYTDKNVDANFKKIGKELGFIEAGVAQGRVELATWFANPENVKGDKAAVIAKLMEDTKVAKATAETRYGMFLFAKEYCKALG